MEQTKQCSKCFEVKPVSEFHKCKSFKDGYQYNCKLCRKQHQEDNKDKISAYKKQYQKDNKDNISAYQKQYREENRDKISERKKQYYECNKDKLCEQKKQYYEDNKDKILTICKQYREDNKDKITERKKQYYECNKDKILTQHKYYRANIQDKNATTVYQKQYREDNKERLTEYKCNYMRERRRTDIQFKIACNLRRRIALALKGNTKSESTKQLLGIDFDIFIKWLIYQLPPGYSIEDMGAKLHDDHVIPLASFDLTNEEQLHKAMHWTNHQPLEASKNIRKSDKVDPWLAVCQEAKAKYFLKHFN